MQHKFKFTSSCIAIISESLNSCKMLPEERTLIGGGGGGAPITYLVTVGSCLNGQVLSFADQIDAKGDIMRPSNELFTFNLC
jgi:hypothetical protein